MLKSYEIAFVFSTKCQEDIEKDLDTFLKDRYFSKFPELEIVDKYMWQIRRLQYKLRDRDKNKYSQGIYIIANIHTEKISNEFIDILKFDVDLLRYRILSIGKIEKKGYSIRNILKEVSK